MNNFSECIESFIMTTSGKCISLADISGVVNIADGNCVENAKVDDYGVCFCPIGFIEAVAMDGVTCASCSTVSGATTNNNGECACPTYGEAIQRENSISWYDSGYDSFVIYES